jgi:hypothetical protein
MGSAKEQAHAALVENGLEPEYLITDIVRAEPVSGGMMRLYLLYLAVRKHKTLVLQFTVIASVQDFATMSKQVMQMAADRHNLALWQDMDGGEQN